MKVKQKTECGQQSKEKYLVQCHGRGLANEEDEKEHGWFRGFEGWVAYGFGLSLSLLLSLSFFPQIRGFNTHFFLKHDVIFQGITRRSSSFSLRKQPLSLLLWESSNYVETVEMDFYSWKQIHHLWLLCHIRQFPSGIEKKPQKENGQ